MSKGDNSPGISRLAGIFKEFSAPDTDSEFNLDFGVIQSDNSLLTNSYPIPIPLSDYIICRSLQGHTETSTEASVGDHGSHTHKVETRQAVKPGDRVLVAWVDDDAVVIDVILDASQVL